MEGPEAGTFPAQSRSKEPSLLRAEQARVGRRNREVRVALRAEDKTLALALVGWEAHKACEAAECYDMTVLQRAVRLQWGGCTVGRGDNFHGSLLAMYSHLQTRNRHVICVWCMNGCYAHTRGVLPEHSLGGTRGPSAVLPHSSTTEHSHCPALPRQAERGAQPHVPPCPQDPVQTPVSSSAHEYGCA